MTLLYFYISILIPTLASCAQPATDAAWVHLSSGALATSRCLSSQRYRHASQVRLLSATPNHDLWLLTLPPHQQESVLTTVQLQSASVHILHSLPGVDTHAWMVYADADTMQSLLDRHDFVAVARVPPQLKVSPRLKQLTSTASTMSEASLLEELNHQQVQYFIDADDRVVVKLVASLESASEIVDVARRVQQAVEQLAPATQLDKRRAVTPLGVHLQIPVPVMDLESVLDWLAVHPEVTWIDFTRQHRVHDLYSVAATQAPGQISPGFFPAPDVTVNSYRPFWRSGLDGTGQLVGVTDSGLDLDSCLVQDPNTTDGSGFTVENVTLVTAGQSVIQSIFVNPNGRKVVAYIPAEDDRDDNVTSHGTHTTTSIIGIPAGQSPNTTTLNAVGAAPGSRVVFWDAALTNATGGTDGNIYTDGVFSQTTVYPLMRKLGASVTSNSWGSEDYLYTSTECTALDTYAYQNPNMLHVFSAGNDGLLLPNTTGTVNSPGTCKNVISVGAVENYVWAGTDDIVMFNETAATGPYLDGRGASDLIFQAYDAAGVAASAPVLLVDGTGLGCGPNNTFAGCDVVGAYDDIPDNLWKLLNVKSQVLQIPCPTTLASISTPSPANRSVTVLIPTTCSDNDIQLMLKNLNIGAFLFYPVTSSSTTSGNRRRLMSTTTTSEHVETYDLSFWQAILARFNPKPKEVLTCPNPIARMWATSSIDSLTDAYSTAASQAAAQTTVSLNSYRAIAIVLAPGLAKLQSLLTQTANRIFVTWAKPNASNPFPWENVADFSSIGSSQAFPVNGIDPTDQYYRIKPDMVAPGWLEAGTSDAQQSFELIACNISTRILAGTSMSCPQVAAAALLVRQYFMDGYYPTGASVASDAFTPSAALIRAVLTAGTTAMKGIAAVTGVPLTAPPSQYQGFGRLDLSNTLPLAGNANKILRVTQGNVSLASPSFAFSLNVTNANQSLAFALVWHDPPSFAGAVVSWVNNLDLIVTGPGGNIYYPNGRQSADPVNNVEKITIAQAPAGVYDVTVNATYLSVIGTTTSQPFALAINAGSNNATVADAGLKVSPGTTSTASPPLTSAPLSPPPPAPRSSGPRAVDNLVLVSAASLAAFILERLHL